MNEVRIAWAAGILEGEGTFMLYRRKKGVSARIVVKMTDRDVIESLRDTFDEGRIWTGKEADKGHKTAYTWYVGRREQVEEILKLVRPYMHSRRTAKIDEILEALGSSKKGLPTGVYKVTGYNNYRAMYKDKHLGVFETPEEASVAYNKARKGDSRVA